MFDGLQRWLSLILFGTAERDAKIQRHLDLQNRLAEIDIRLKDVAASIELHPDLLREQVSLLVGKVTVLAAGAQATDAALSNQHGAMANEVNAILNTVIPVRHSVAALEMRLSELNAAQQQSGIDTLLARSAELVGTLSNSQATSLSRQGEMANEVNAILNVVLPLQQRILALETRIDGLDRAMTDARAFDQAHNMLLARSTLALTSRRADPSSGAKVVATNPLPTASLQAQMTAFKAAAPNNFEAWYKAYVAGVEEGQRTPEGNLSHEGHIGAGYFRMFINVHARGRILDVGCGPLPLPAYLVDCPLESLAGIDPQDPHMPHPFAFAKTFAETIPWPAASFDTVVVATSLDHVYLLDKALAEIKRVLAPGGRLLLWTALLQSTPSYDPYGPAFEPPDQYHLFHPGLNWFYELFRSDYHLIERLPTVSSAEFVAFERIGSR